MARKRRSAPDLRDPVTTHRLPPWTDSDVEALAKRHGFPADFKLSAWMNQAWMLYESRDLRTHPKGRDVKTAIDIAGQQARALRQTLERFGAIGRKTLHDHFSVNVLVGVDVRDTTPNIDELVASLRDLEFAAALAVRNAASSKRGPKGDAALHLFLQVLYRAHRQAVGPDKGTYTAATDASVTVSEDGRYSGPTVRLFEDLLKLLSIRKTNKAIGRLVEGIAGRANKSR